ncbi:hypothetical protein CFSAN001627_06910 [Clostridium botulinum CFSAN001627]|uniref:Uncharacterized protein n=1 Tax=Clostridium botulinum CFSAN001627 TaxID=1232189 RepID=M1ZSQ7_CLOBO|nr:hypothetical protein CFSAN001627_06910 [Clostridium botulinum CFSAN001627]
MNYKKNNGYFSYPHKSIDDWQYAIINELQVRGAMLGSKSFCIYVSFGLGELCFTTSVETRSYGKIYI